MNPKLANKIHKLLKAEKDFNGPLEHLDYYEKAYKLLQEAYDDTILINDIDIITSATEYNYS